MDRRVLELWRVADVCVGGRESLHWRIEPSKAIVGDSGRAREQLGWAPELDFEQLAHLLVDADLERLQAPATSMERR